MTPKLKLLFDRLEIQRRELIQRLATESDDRLNTHPPGAWSVNQVIAHVITGERMALNYVQKKILAYDQVGNAGAWEEVKMLILMISQRLPLIKFKAPKVVVEQTRDSSSFGDLCSEWDRVRSDWVTLLDKIPPGGEGKMIYKHVVAGKLGLKHGLLFMREHLIHHVPQINRLLKKG